MTVKELRNTLFNVENQQLTVKELRRLLFELEDDKEVTPELLAEITKK